MKASPDEYTQCFHSLLQRPEFGNMPDDQEHACQMCRQARHSRGSPGTSKEDNESRMPHRHDVVVQDLFSCWIHSYPVKKIKLQRHDDTTAIPASLTHSGKNVHRHSHQFARGARRVSEGSVSVLVKSGPTEGWWKDAMECCWYLRDVHDPLTDGQTAIKID